jgi:hypothetical protein
VSGSGAGGCYGGGFARLLAAREILRPFWGLPSVSLSFSPTLYPPGDLDLAVPLRFLGCSLVQAVAASCDVDDLRSMQ